MKKSLIILFFFKIIHFSNAQDSTLIGRFAISGLGSYSKSNIIDEIAKSGFGLQFRYFPTPKAAFIINFQNVWSAVERYGKISRGANFSLGFGVEKHIPIGNFSPYLGLEAGINFTRVHSDLIQLPVNSQFFQNDLPNYLLKPKLGVLYKINENLHAQFETTFNWVISADRQNTNPLFDDAGKPIYFGRKVVTGSIGIMYLFGE